MRPVHDNRTGDANHPGRAISHAFKRVFHSLVTLLVLAGAVALLAAAIARTPTAEPVTMRDCNEWWLAALRAGQGRR